MNYLINLHDYINEVKDVTDSDVFDMVDRNNIEKSVKLDVLDTYNTLPISIQMKNLKEIEKIAGVSLQKDNSRSDLINYVFINFGSILFHCSEKLNEPTIRNLKEYYSNNEILKSLFGSMGKRMPNKQGKYSVKFRDVPLDEKVLNSVNGENIKISISRILKNSDYEPNKRLLNNILKIFNELSFTRLYKKLDSIREYDVIDGLNEKIMIIHIGFLAFYAPDYAVDTSYDIDVLLSKPNDKLKSNSTLVIEAVKEMAKNIKLQYPDSYKKGYSSIFKEMTTKSKSGAPKSFETFYIDFLKEVKERTDIKLDFNIGIYGSDSKANYKRESTGNWHKHIGISTLFLHSVIDDLSETLNVELDPISACFLDTGEAIEILDEFKNTIELKLTEYVTHELTHASQDKQGHLDKGSISKYKIDKSKIQSSFRQSQSYKEYYNEPAEVEAFAVGTAIHLYTFYIKNKHIRLELKDIIRLVYNVVNTGETFKNSSQKLGLPRQINYVSPVLKDRLKDFHFLLLDSSKKSFLNIFYQTIMKKHETYRAS